MTRIKEDEIRNFVNEEVLHCVSCLIHEITRFMPETHEYYDELLSILLKEDWVSAAEDNGTLEEDGGQYRFVNDCTNGVFHDELEEAAYEFCQDNDIDPYKTEAYEHWIVSERLAKNLAKQGEMVTTDFMGLTIWGRTTTGQAIYLDRVIQEIYLDLEIGNSKYSDRS